MGTIHTILEPLRTTASQFPAQRDFLRSPASWQWPGKCTGTDAMDCPWICINPPQHFLKMDAGWHRRKRFWNFLRNVETISCDYHSNDRIWNSGYLWISGKQFRIPLMGLGLLCINYRKIKKDYVIGTSTFCLLHNPFFRVITNYLIQMYTTYTA